MTRKALVTTYTHPIADSGAPTPTSSKSAGYGSVEEGLKALSGKKRESNKFDVGDRLLLWENEIGDMHHYPCHVTETDGKY
eukprot:CAMPEP_0198229368 /NCGR_PEP_ID=MMETSP1445-20131203/114088_1 /TAXON_ID=36898 /ORGANISM="Pyramimonas sp., Strain CCMP2087" /LENGTH=80 /DNA_ID=CAMNT_0043909825 /DNA_START=1273 /DNA_END=1516 /DNA_ORIENTATION=-